MPQQLSLLPGIYTLERLRGQRRILSRTETAQLDGPRVVYLSVASSIAFINEEWP
jgi:hypothetical protein